MFYPCKIKTCKGYNKINLVESFLYKHYLKHTRVEINSLADSMGIKNAYHENRFTLINEIIKRGVYT
jgi:hypothetical protein